MTVTGIIFSNIHDSDIPELTAMRTTSSIPFACRYRFIDFALSNMVNSGITDVDIITHYNYRSLMDHVGSGKDWDLARRTGGLTILPPYASAYTGENKMYYNTRLEALKSTADTISRITSDLVVLSDCDNVLNIDLSDVIDYHLKEGADATVCTYKTILSSGQSEKYNVVVSDEENNVTEIINHPKHYRGDAEVCINIWVMNRKFLQDAVQEAVIHGYDSLTRDIISQKIGRSVLKVYKFTGFFAQINGLVDYFNVSMKMLDSECRRSLFNVKNRTVYTKVRNSAPTKYAEGAEVCNSLIADGCVVEGKVENSILFRGVKVGKNAVVKNSILFQDVQISESAFVNCIVADKNVVIRTGVMLSGHESMPLCIPKGKNI